MIKLIASDFDGTLNRSDNTVSDYSREVIAEFIKDGGYFTIATGRNQPSLAIALEKAGVLNDVAGISCQGAFVSMVQSGKMLREAYLENQIVTEALKIFSNYAIQLYQGENVYRNRPQSVFADMYWRVTGVEPIYTQSFAPYLERVPKLIVAEFSACTKFKEKLAEFEKAFKDRISFDFTGDEMLEIYSSEAGKGKAVQFLAEQFLGITASEVATFGDSRNDISMIEYAGYGVATKNADESVKARADHICESNDNDGVAKTIAGILEKK